MPPRNIRRARSARTALIAGFTAALLAVTAQAHKIYDEHPGAHHADDEHAAPAETLDGVRTLVRAFRQSGDDAHLDAAWSLIQPRLGDHDTDTAVLIDAATVAQSRHDFMLALELIDRALGENPYMDQAWLLRASVALVLGEVDNALDACRRLRRVPAIVAVTCRARVSIARGEDEKALRQMTAVLAHVHEEEAGTDRLAWSFSVAGDAAATLDPLRAASLYDNSLTYAESTQVRAALVDVLLRAGQIDRARAALDSGSGALPLAVRRMIVAKREGREAELAREIADTDSRFQRWIGDEDWLHAREMARFYLDVLPRPALARRLAERNLTLQREPEDLLLARRVERCASCND